MNKKEIELAKTGSLPELCRWWEHTFFSHEAQVVLVERQDEDILIEYATHFSFCKEAQVKMVELRLKKALLQQLQHHPLCAAAQKLLIQTLL